MANLTRVARNVHQKEIVKLFDGLQGSRNMWQLWSDFVVMAACAISNAMDKSHWEEREQIYKTIAAGYTEQDLSTFASIFALLVEAYGRDPDQDLLGELYMALELGNDKNGQFFTPYDVCRCTAELNWGNAANLIEERGWISVNDPAVGAGALLIAFANTCTRKGINYQQHCLFVAQEIDLTTACMCYIQLSLLGCPGYVYVGDSISDPCTCIDDNALIPAKPAKCWFTPMYFHNTWQGRVLIEQMRLIEKRLFGGARESKTAGNDFNPASGPAAAPFVQGSEPKNVESVAEAIRVAEAEDGQPDSEIELLTNENGQLMLF